MTIPSGMQGLRAALSAHAGTTARARQVLPGIYFEYGAVQLDGTGEVDHDISFPVPFVDMPVVLGGGALQEGETLHAGQYPIISATPASWSVRELPGGSRLYLGCRLAIVVTGHDRMQSIATWMAIGPALVNPSRPSPSSTMTAL